MTDSTSLSSAEKKPETPSKQKKQSKNVLPTFLSLSALVIVCAVSVYAWQLEKEKSILLERYITTSETETRTLSSSLQQLQQQINNLNELSAKQQALIDTLSQESYFQSQKLSDLGARSRNDWLLAEAEYLMHLANQRLTLEQDVSSAEAILLSADKILLEINDPGLVEIRQALANEIISLQQIQHTDYQGLFLKLDALIHSLDTLQQDAFVDIKTQRLEAESHKAPDSQSSSFLSIWNSIWNDLKTAVSIRRLDQPVEPLLTPEQHYYLKQNLKLMLEQASLALIDKNSILFQSSLTKAQNWLTQYFTQSDARVIALKQQISELSPLKLEQKVPDISTSLRLTKAKIETFYKRHTLDKMSSPSTEKKKEPDTILSEDKSGAL